MPIVVAFFITTQEKSHEEMYQSTDFLSSCCRNSRWLLFPATASSPSL